MKTRIGRIGMAIGLIYSEDHIHPNAAGAKVIASMISAKLVEICRIR